MVFNLILVLIVMLSFVCPVNASDWNTPTGGVSDPLVEAQEKLMYAKGNYATIRQQEEAIQNMRRATKLNLKAAKLRARAEKLQNRADILVGKANQQALSRGLYITNPLAPAMQSQPVSGGVQQSAQAPPSVVPVPGRPINIIVPRQEEVTYEEIQTAPNLPPLNNF